MRETPYALRTRNGAACAKAIRSGRTVEAELSAYGGVRHSRPRLPEHLRRISTGEGPTFAAEGSRFGGVVRL